ncbi:lipocalin family protein [Capnocytophaga canis]|uniref:lipocalin family protein n=1 Tax=Capnocytophaga canis TaxID=1848903 RepID=UPI0037D00D34
MKRKLTFLFLAMALTLSCSKNDKNEGEQPNGKELSKSEIVGTWRFEMFVGDFGTRLPNDCHTRTNIVFREDNTFTMDEYELINGRCENRKYSGTYDLSRLTLTLGHNYIKFFFIRDNKLFIVEGNNSQQRFVRR